MADVTRPVEIELKRARAALERIRDDVRAMRELTGDDSGGDAA